MEEEEETRRKNKPEIDEKKFQYEKFYLALISLYINLFTDQYWNKPKIKRWRPDFFWHKR